MAKIFATLCDRRLFSQSKASASSAEEKERERSEELKFHKNGRKHRLRDKEEEAALERIIYMVIRFDGLYGRLPMHPNYHGYKVS